MKISVIGAGSWGRNLIRNFAGLGVLDSICDHNYENAASAAQEHGVSSKSWQQILDDSSVTGVVIATQSHLHYQFAAEALKKNKHVLVEKPMADNLRDAKSLCALASQANRKLMVGHLLQYHPGFVKLKEIAAQNKLGRLRYLYSHRLNFGKIYAVKDALWDLAPHDLSMVLSLTNSDPINIRYNSSENLKPGIADFAMLNLEFPEGVKAHIFVSWLNPVKEQKIVVIGEEAMAIFDDTKPLEQKLAFYPHRVEWQGDIPIALKADVQYIELDRSEPLKQECAHFIDCITNDKDPLTNASESIRILNILEKSESIK